MTRLAARLARIDDAHWAAKNAAELRFEQERTQATTDLEAQQAHDRYVEDIREIDAKWDRGIRRIKQYLGLDPTLCGAPEFIAYQDAGIEDELY